uniref:CN hydrolase domain-containing protein n=1 Tax=Steinernema glaseri TaxID=37863 RepID=A0A1I8AVM8_9BILA
LLCTLHRLRERKGFMAIGALLLFAPWIIGLALKGHAWTVPSGEPLKVAAIQGNIEQELKWDPEQLNRQLALYRDMSFSSRPVDLIVWPETAVPVLKEQAQGYLDMMGSFATDRHSALITGVPDMLRGLIAFFDLPMSDFARGPEDQAMLQAKGYHLAPMICYEVVYPELAASLAAKSDILLTISNDTWFGKSIGPIQHLQMAQMRALEAGRWMIRATNNGVTGLID